MPSQLTQSVRSAINAFVANQTSEGEHLPADILRIVRDEASNLLERQLICDTLDADPYQLCQDDKNVRKQMKRFQQLMSVVSCSRTKTLEGHVNVHCVVELSRDAKMNRNVKECIRLEFTYDRSPASSLDHNMSPPFEADCGADSTGNERNQSRCLDDDGNISMATAGGVEAHKATRVLYSIDFSRDYGKKQRLVTIEVMASGEAPSAEHAIPMEDEDDNDNTGKDDEEKAEEDVWEDYDEDGELEEMHAEDEKIAASRKVEKTCKKTAHEEESKDNASQSAAAEGSFVADGKDRYAAYVDPDSLYEFLSCTGLVFDEATTIYFLMSFPFFEHEWDLLGFLLDVVFGGDGDDSSEEGRMDDDDE